MKGVLNGEALTEKLGIPGNFDARGSNRLELLLDRRRGADSGAVAASSGALVHEPAPPRRKPVPQDPCIVA